MRANGILAAAIVCAAVFVCIAVTIVVRRSKHKKMPVPAVILCVFGLAASGAGAFLFGFLSDYYHALPSAEKYLADSEGVTVTKNGGTVFFDGAGESEALIFYPGAKVEYTAYAPLLHRLAEEGIDCWAVEMPLNIALLGINSAEDIVAQGGYERYYLAGHSMGGVAASSWCSKNPNRADGLILLASYPVSRLDDPLGVLSVYGSSDGVLDMESYEKSKSLLPADHEEKCIEGGNHAGFADYGAQKGDGEAEITPEEQTEQTVRLIADFITRRRGSARQLNNPFP